jgi:hypothetical protein
MDAFEQVVASLLERDGYWVRSCVKVNLTKEEKCAIGRKSSPRWELDLVAYKGATNELWIVECKSYLDSGGVSMSAFDGSNPKFGGRFKLFNSPILLDTVIHRLCAQLVASGACSPSPTVRLVLAAGRIASDTHRASLRAHFESREWILWDEAELKKRITALSDESYENAVASVVSKILVRQR